MMLKMWGMEKSKRWEYDALPGTVMHVVKGIMQYEASRPLGDFLAMWQARHHLTKVTRFSYNRVQPAWLLQFETKPRIPSVCKEKHSTIDSDASRPSLSANAHGESWCILEPLLMGVWMRGKFHVASKKFLSYCRSDMYLYHLHWRFS